MKCTCKSWSIWGLKCPDCSDKSILKNNHIPTTIEKVFLPDFGYASKKQLGEMDRRRIIKHNPDGSYVLGRLGENGKIQDRHPDYRS